MRPFKGFDTNRVLQYLTNNRLIIMKSLLDNIKYRDYASPIEQNIAAVFQEALNEYFNSEWTIIHNVLIPLINGKHFEVDLIIAKNNYPVAIVEIKRSLDNRSCLALENQLNRTAAVLYASLCIACSSEEMFSFPAGKSSVKVEMKAFNKENIRQALENVGNNGDVTIDEIKSKWKGILKQFDFETKDEVDGFITQITECDIVNEPNSFYLDEKKEDLLFRKILGEYKKDDLCRFTTINSIFRTCNEKEQSMCCIVCMNDKSETDYATQKLNLMVQNDSEEINSCYILSCCDIDSRNNLTMWRLYADDARGVCIEYKIENIEDNFFLAPICYARDENQEHPEMKLIRRIQEEKINGKSFKFNRLFIWKHFFKPFEYKDEKEIRLLFNKKCISSEPKDYGIKEKPSFQRKWIYELGFGIISPIVTFPIEKSNNHFPLLLNRITFGPKAKEVDVNISQLAYLIEVKGIKRTDIGKDFIKESSIKHYR